MRAHPKPGRTYIMIVVADKTRFLSISFALHSCCLQREVLLSNLVLPYLA